MAESYAPLVHHTLARDARLHRRSDAATAARVSSISPALQVMTDLEQVDAVRVAPGIAMRVRGLFSTSRVGRQFGATLEVGETAHGFAEIGAALRS